MPFIVENLEVGAEIIVQKITVKESGAEVKGLMKTKQDIHIDMGKGVVLISPNGHRWRIGVTNLGQLVQTDLDV